MIDVFAIIDDLKIRTKLSGREVTFIELNRSGGPHPAVALLVFVDGAESPFGFIKASAEAERAARLQQEYDNLTRLHRSGGKAIRAGVPEPLYSARVDDLFVVAESAVPGTRIKDLPPDAYFASERFRRHARSLTDWLLELARCLAGEGTGLPSGVSGGDAERAVAAYRSGFSVSPALSALFDETLAWAHAASIPGVPLHGDFCTANVLATGDDRLSVIDWEYPLALSWPLADLLYFFGSTWCLPYRKGQDAVRDNFGRMFFEDHGFAAPLRESVARYAGGLGLDQESILPLSTLSWIGYANRKKDDLAQMSNTAATHLPLILIDGDACVNLELLAERRDRYLPG